LIRTFRYPLIPNVAQRRVLDGWVESCRQLYNAALQQRREAWERRRVSLSYMDQTRELAALRRELPEWAAIPSEVERSALRRLQRGFDGFFRRVKRGEKPGFPRFRGRDRYDSFDVGRARIDGDRVHLPKLGSVRFRLYRELRGKILSVGVQRRAGRWKVCIACDLGEAPTKIPVRTAIGIDLGLTSFAVLSSGEAIDNPRFFRQGEAVLARRQRSLSKKRRGSASRARAKLLVANAHEHIRNQRLDFSRKLVAALFDRFDLVAHEDLNIRNMVRGNLAKSIYDAAWGSFVHALACKAECAGKWAVPVDPRGTTQRCSACNTVVPKSLSEREHRCLCGFEAGRDHNAALNVLSLGRRLVHGENWAEGLN